ncbi:hypothetical protein EDB81DRAFT_758615 [Dactylonectria macrodidyma]|uniref:Uncharacterized protein n=1 Tax=Dactylonectria macrodidyma TaxID=307937 RepID=A0A9P9JE46_9HYPO|nr:hypothetical protein EDB81DRAFT_758615 [Dactylonectria macrodidyma]
MQGIGNCHGNQGEKARNTIPYIPRREDCKRDVASRCASMPVSGSQFGDYATIHQDVYYYAQPHRQARVVRVIPPRNAEVIHRPDLVSKLDKLLPRAPEHYSAALWGLGGSGPRLRLPTMQRR